MVKGIESLTLKNFRGATVPVTFTFDAAKPIIMVFGENGSGKSTLADALDFLCNNEFGSLKDRASANARTSIVAQGAKPGDLEITLKYAGAEWSAKLASGKPHTISKGGKQPPRALILRRADILRIVELQPAKRYEAVREFISVPRIEEAENNLKAAKKAVDIELEEATALFAQAHDSLDRLWAAEKGPGRDAVAWARLQLRDDTRALQARVTAADALLNAIATLRDAHAQWASDAGDAQAARRALEVAAQQLSDAERGREAGAETLVAVLQEAQRYLQATGSADACPVCGKPEAPDVLRQRVETQLRALNDLVRLRGAREQAERRFQQEQAAATRAQRTLGERARDLAEARRGVAEIDAVLAQSLQALPQPDAETLGKAVGELMPGLLQRATALQAQRDATQKTLNLQNTLRISLETIDEKGKESQSLTRLSQRLERMLAVVSRHRKAFVEQQLQEIAGTVDAYFNRLHPGEGLGNITLSLKATTSGSVEMGATFGNQTDISPTAYYSEAHLDTLGLCVYLALAGKAAQGSTLIVLDDILTSVDDAHLERIITLLHEEAGKFGQVVCTTHLRAWRDRYRFGAAPSGQVQLMELYAEWTSERGIGMSKTKPSVDELKHYLGQSPMDRQIVASKAGVLLESLLDELTLRYRCRLPRMAEPHYTLGDLLGGLGPKLKGALKVEWLNAQGQPGPAQPLGAVLDKLSGMTWIRNQVGAHFNSDGAMLADSDVREFAKSALELAGLLMCPECGAIPDRDKSGSHWECGGTCKRTRLHPLQAPQ